MMSWTRSQSGPQHKRYTAPCERRLSENRAISAVLVPLRQKERIRAAQAHADASAPRRAAK
jgi:hypothetical protein